MQFFDRRQRAIATLVASVLWCVGLFVGAPLMVKAVVSLGVFVTIVLTVRAAMPPFQGTLKELRRACLIIEIEALVFAVGGLAIWFVLRA